MTVTTTAVRTTTVMSTSPVVRPTTVIHKSSYKSTSTAHVKSRSTNDGKTSSKPFVSATTVKSSSSAVVNSTSTKYPTNSTVNVVVTNQPNKGDEESSDENHVGVVIGSIIGGLLFLIILVSIASVIAWQCG